MDPPTQSEKTPLSDRLANSSTVSLHFHSSSSALARGSTSHLNPNYDPLNEVNTAGSSQNTKNKFDPSKQHGNSNLERSPNLASADDTTLTNTSLAGDNNHNNNQLHRNYSHQGDSQSIQPSEYSVTSITELTNMLNPERSLPYILALTIILGGLQMAWTVEFSEGTPFLLSLGISKLALALVWIAGPLSGTIGQPIIGILSDNSNSRFGRRRPFIIGGCVVICLTLFMLSHCVEFIGSFIHGDEDYIKLKSIPLATFGIYLLDFSISAFQAASRSFIVDMVPSHQQQLSNAWAARMIGGFNIFGYYLGSVDLTKYTPSWFGENQFKSLTTSAIILLTFITFTGCYLIKERDPRNDILIRTERKKTEKKLKDLGLDENDTSIKNLIYSLYKQTRFSISKLSPQVKIVNATEFLAWIGYFPMLFYTTTYVGELYIYEVVTQRLMENLPPFTNQEKIKLYEDSTRRGSTALLVHSISSLIVNVILPHFVKQKKRTTSRNIAQRLYSESNDIDSDDYEDPVYNTLRTLPNNRFKALLLRLQKYKISIQMTWTISHLVFILCMISTFWIKDSKQAIIMFAFLGIPWGSALWAPFVLIAEEVTRIKEKKSMSASNSIISRGVGSTSSVIPTTNRRRQKYQDYEHEPGIILGIHNVFVSAPQVVSSLFSSFLFKALSSRFGKDDKFLGKFDDSLGWVFRFGGVMAIGAFFVSLRVKNEEELEREDEEDDSLIV